MEIKVVSYKKIPQGNIKGFADIVINTEGLPITIKGMKVVSSQNGGHFYAFPDKCVSGVDGDKYYPIVGIFEKEAHAKFRTMLDTAFKEYFKNPSEEKPLTTTTTFSNQSDDDDCPF